VGSFTEASLGFSFRNDVPAEVLAAFSALAPVERPANWPPLPDPVVEPVVDWAPDWAETSAEPDPYEGQPWRHDWATWMSSAMGVQTTPHGRLEWSRMGRWHLDCRFSFKLKARGVFKFLRWLGPHIHHHDGQNLFVGTLHFEYDERPHLLWCSDGELRLESLAQQGPARPPALPRAGQLIVVTGLPGSGKSSYLRSLAEQNPDWLVIDDYQKGAHQNLPEPRASRHFSAMVADLVLGRTVVVTDVSYCHLANVRALALATMSAAPFTVLSVRAFDNDPVECEANILARGTDVDLHLRRLAELWPAYEPIGDVMSVGRG